MNWLRVVVVRDNLQSSQREELDATSHTDHVTQVSVTDTDSMHILE